MSWLKLDGSVPVNERQGVANRFNADPSIDLLLLTTQVPRPRPATAPTSVWLR